MRFKGKYLFAFLFFVLILLFLIFFPLKKQKTQTSFKKPQEVWVPSVGSSWQIQLSGQPIDQSVDVPVYDIDYETTDASVVSSLHQKGKKVICYINMGAWENFRSDKDLFPPSVLGKVYQGFEDERWFDIRRIDILAPLLEKRIDTCKAKGFDGIDPDNLDGYTNDTGFPLTYQDQIRFNKWVATAAKQRGLAVGLKNDVEQIPDLVLDFDWIVTEHCFFQGWCEKTLPLIQRGKPVFAIEYTEKMSEEQFLKDVCSKAQKLQIDVIFKTLALNSFYLGCRQ